MNETIRPIDCWDDCDCEYCQEHRREWLADGYNQRAIKWLKEKERDRINEQVLKQDEIKR